MYLLVVYIVPIHHLIIDPLIVFFILEKEPTTMEAPVVDLLSNFGANGEEYKKKFM